MTDLEISKALALAIGWNGNCVRIIGGHVCCYVKQTGWRVFDYMDWNVIGPIAARYDCFPSKYTHLGGKWQAFCAMDGCSETGVADTPQKSIALAVIEGVKK